MKIVPATAELIDKFYDGKPLPTMRAYVVLNGEDEPIAVAGFFYRTQKQRILFSDIKNNENAKHKVLTMRVAKKLMKIADENDWTLIAYPNPEIETATQFLSHLGFVPGENGEYVRWAA